MVLIFLAGMPAMNEYGLIGTPVEAGQAITAGRADGGPTFIDRNGIDWANLLAQAAFLAEVIIDGYSEPPQAQAF